MVSIERAESLFVRTTKECWALLRALREKGKRYTAMKDRSAVVEKSSKCGEIEV